MTRFRPSDPKAVHERFERIKARTLKRMEEEERALWRRLEAIQAAADQEEQRRRPGAPGRRPVRAAPVDEQEEEVV